MRVFRRVSSVLLLVGIVLLGAWTASALADNQLTVTVNGPGSVQTSPEGVACGQGCSSYPDDTEVRLIAIPLIHAAFSGWSGACPGIGMDCLLTMDADKSATASFRPYYSDVGDDDDPGPPELGKLEVSPVSKKIGPGSTVTIKAKISNIGYGRMPAPMVCAKGPRSLVIVSKCVSFTYLEPSGSAYAGFKVRVKDKVRSGRKINLVFRASAPGLSTETAKATLRVRESA